LSNNILQESSQSKNPAICRVNRFLAWWGLQFANVAAEGNQPGFGRKTANIHRRTPNFLSVSVET
jgi:hypothetical protein